MGIFHHKNHAAIGVSPLMEPPSIRFGSARRARGAQRLSGGASGAEGLSMASWRRGVVGGRRKMGSSQPKTVNSCDSSD